MRPFPRPFRTRYLAAAALLALAAGTASAAVAAVTATWSPAQPARVGLSSLVYLDTQYTDLVATFGELISFSATGPNRSHNNFNPTNGRLTIASIDVGGTTFYDVVVTVTDLVSVRGSAPLTEFVPNDPLFTRQWHLKNTGQMGVDGPSAKPGEDLNITKAWRQATGTGIQIAVVDDGLDIHHEDLNVVPGKSWDFRTGAYGDPSSAEGRHGTSCGGLAAAIGHNNLGVAGVAFNARLVGYNLLTDSTASNEAQAVTQDLTDNHIYTNSYGAEDGVGPLFPSDQLWRESIELGLSTGRGGKGAIYTWAAGNGAPRDRSDYDGQANFRGVLAIGALNAQGTRSEYSEPGANLLAVAYGGEYCDTQATTTVDITGSPGYNNGRTQPEDLAGEPNYTRCMNGTSAAAPMAAGVVALLLDVNPNLTWRDVRAVLASTARKTDPAHPDWVQNGAGHHVNHSYGYGALDAFAATQAAASWANLPPQKTPATQGAPLASPLAMPDNAEAVTSSLVLQGSGITQLEFVELTIVSDHPNVGNLDITLTSPSGTVSTVSTVRECEVPEGTVDDETGAAVEGPSCGDGLASGFTFGIARLMGEPADGNWTLAVRDGKATESGAITSWRITAHGH